MLITARTFRMGGHATHDEAEARALFPDEKFAYWGRRDPVGTYETWLLERRQPLTSSAASGDRSQRLAAHRRLLEEVEERVAAEVDAAAAEALASREDDMPDPSTLTAHVLRDSSAGPEEPAFAPLEVTASTATGT